LGASVLSVALALALTSTACAQDAGVEALAEPAALEAVPRPAIGRRIEETFHDLQDVTPSLRRQPTVIAIRSAMPVFTLRVGRLRDDPSLERLDTLHPASLHDLEQEWSRVHTQLTNWQGALETRSTQLAEEREHVLNARQLWRLSLDADRERPLADAQRVRIDSLLTRIRRIKHRLDRREEEVIDLQGELSDEGLRIAAVIARIRSAQRQARQRRQERDHRPIWLGWQRVETGAEPTSMADVSAEHAASVVTFVRTESTTLTWHLVGFLGLFSTFFWLRRSGGKKLAQGRPSAHRALRAQPLAASLLLSLIVPPLLYAYLPAVIQGAILMVMVPAIVALSPHLLPGARRPLMALLTLTAISVPINLGFMPVSVQRIPVLLLQLATIAYSGGLFWAKWAAVIRASKPRQRRVFRLVQLSVLPLGLAVYFSLTGYTERGQLWTAATLAAVEQAIGLFFATELMAAALREGLRAPLSSRISFTVRARRREVGKLLIRGSRWVAFFIFLYVTLASFDALDPTLDWLRINLRRTFEFGEIELSLGDIASFLTMIVGTIAVMRVVHSMLDLEILPRLSLEQGIASAISLSVSYVLVAIGVVLAFGSAGVGPEKLALLGGALGVGIGFGLQNVVSNFVSGLILVAERPIKVSDVIEIGELVGTVRRIGIRSSTVESLDGAEVIVPNSDLISGHLVNWTHSDARRRLKLVVGTAYAHDPVEVTRVLTKVVQSQPGVLNEPPADVLCTGFGSSSVDFTVRAWTAGYLDAIQIKSTLAARVYAALEREGIEMPFPQQDLHLRTISEEASRRLNGEEA